MNISKDRSLNDFSIEYYYNKIEICYDGSIYNLIKSFYNLGDYSFRDFSVDCSVDETGLIFSYTHSLATRKVEMGN